MDRKIKITAFIFLLRLLLLLTSCTEFNLNSELFSTIWDAYVIQNSEKILPKKDVVSYGYTEVSYFEDYCRKGLYNNQRYEELSEEEQIDELYSSCHDIRRFLYSARHVKNLSMGMSTYSKSTDEFWACSKYYNKFGGRYVAYSGVCTINNEKCIYYVLFKDRAFWEFP